MNKWAVMALTAAAQISVLVAVAMLAACTRIETGEIGLGKSYTGQISTVPLQSGLHQSLTQTVLVFTAKESIFPIKNLHPQTKDKLVMKGVDISYAYSVAPAAVGELYISYGPTAHWEDKGEIYPMAAFVENLLRSAVNDAVSKFDALQVNDNRKAIEAAIEDDVRRKITAEKLDGKVNIRQIILTSILIPDSVTNSATEVVTAQNTLKAKEFELKTAQVEAERIRVLAAQADSRYIQYLNAQAFLELAKTKPAYVIIPQDFGKSGFVSIPPIK